MPAHQSKTIIALDVGERRIGVATARQETGLAQPWGVIERTADAVEQIKTLATEQGATTVVVGLPRGLEGQDTHQTHLVREFADELKRRVGILTHFQDEALTSKQAEEELQQRGVGYNKGAVDALAATYILNDYLKEHQEFYAGE